MQNAGLLVTKRVGEQNFDEIRDLLIVNAVAPAILGEAFVRHTQKWPVEKKMICISSGAGRRAMQGWSAYGSSKAALDHQCRILFEEQKHQQYPIGVLAYGPGVTETSMQEAVRASDQSIPAVKQLTNMKTDGNVFPAERCAEIMIGFIESSKFGRSAIEDVYDILAEENKK
jgi:benzil reductase ((S)-benzoin forming)